MATQSLALGQETEHLANRYPKPLASKRPHPDKV